MAFKLHAVTDTHAIGDEAAKRRYVYIDKKTGKTMTLLAPLNAEDDVASLLVREPSRHHHTTMAGAIQIVTTWSKDRPTR